jgi:hypothetical protein
MDLQTIFFYDFSVRKTFFLSIQFHEGLPIMKLAIRIFALSVVVAGAAAAATTPRSAPAIPSHQSASASLPIPECGPYICPPTLTNAK